MVYGKCHIRTPAPLPPLRGDNSEMNFHTGSQSSPTGLSSYRLQCTPFICFFPFPVSLPLCLTSIFSESPLSLLSVPKSAFQEPRWGCNHFNLTLFNTVNFSWLSVHLPQQISNCSYPDSPVPLRKSLNRASWPSPNVVFATSVWLISAAQISTQILFLFPEATSSNWCS